MKITLFSQILALIDRSIFDKLVSKHDSDKHAKGINSWTHLVSMLFMQLAKAESVRDISNGLRSATGDLNHLGVTKAPCKSSISYITSTVPISYLKTSTLLYWTNWNPAYIADVSMSVS